MVAVHGEVGEGTGVGGAAGVEVEHGDVVGGGSLPVRVEAGARESRKTKRAKLAGRSGVAPKPRYRALASLFVARMSVRPV